MITEPAPPHHHSAPPLADPSLLSMIDILAGCRRVVLTTHARPDGDALGTTAAMALALEKSFIEAPILILTPIPQKYRFLYDEAGVKWHLLGDKGVDPATMFASADALLVCDTGTWSQLEGLREVIEGFAGPKLVLDHHVTQEEWADLKHVDTTAAAAAEVAMGVLEQWQVPIDPKMAQALYVALATDTGWFGFSNTTPRTLRMAAACLEAGADVDRLYQLLNQNERPERMRLQARAHGSLELLADDRLAVMTLTQRDFSETGTKMPATEDLVNWPMAIATVQASILITEDPDSPSPLCKVSFRSKGQIDVAALASTFGGGGHVRAAGARLNLPLAEARDKLTEAIAERMKAGS